MAKQRMTPEERLFNVIQQGGNAAGDPSPAVTPPGGVWVSLWNRLASRWSLSFVTSLLVWMVICSVMVGIMLPMIYRPDVSALEATAAQQSAVPTFLEPAEGLRSQAEYLNLITDRHPFKPIGYADRPADPEPGPDPEATEAERAQQLVSQLRLVGIAQELDGTVAMVELANDERTYVLKAGEVIQELTVEAIYPEHVVFRLGGSTVELY